MPIQFSPGGSGTVTSVSVTTANGVSGSVATATTTPAISLTLGAITPTTVNGNTLTTGTGTLTLGASKTATISNTLTFTGTDASSVAFGAGGTVIYSGGALGSATATTQAQADNSTKVATTAYVDRVGVQQIVSTITGAVATGTTTIPADDTIPQNTEGNQYMSLSITPKSATSKLLIQVVIAAIGTSNATPLNSVLTAALFQDSTANALAVSGIVPDAISATQQITISYVMVSGTTSATTFKVRAGYGAAGTTTFNGSGGGRLYGGALASSIIIQEIGS